MRVLVAAAAVAIALVTLAVPAFASAAGSGAASEEGYSHKGLGPNVPVPAWAKHKDVHFMAPAPSRASRSGEGLNRRPAVTGFGKGKAGEAHNLLGRRCEPHYCPTPPLLYKGGSGVQHSPHIYAIFWGSNWEKEPGEAVRKQVVKMYEGLSGSAFQGILSQYFDSTGRVSSSASVTSYIDTRVATASSVEYAAVEKEALEAIAANHWTSELNSQFVVIPAPGSSYLFEKESFCGYHSMGTDEGAKFTFTFVAYQGDEPFRGCLRFDPHENVGNVTSMIAAHEYAESATDPNPEGGPTWMTSDGWEIGDICSSGDDELPSGSFVQGLWDNFQNQCSLSDPTPPKVVAITENPATVTSQAATLRGKVYSETLKTEYHFEYGPTTSYGTSAPIPNGVIEAGGAVDSAKEVSQKVQGLQLQQTYHYRLVATNSTGTFYGEDRVLSTSLWTVQSTPRPTGIGASPKLQSVSCSAAAECVSVGWGLTRSLEGGGSEDGAGFAERWNGSEWTVQSTPSPTGATSAVLEKVSCTSSSACMAVGSYTESKGYSRPFADHWNGSAWSVVSVPSPSGLPEKGIFVVLTGVACASSSSCVGVGHYVSAINAQREVTEEKTLAESWNGSEWTIVSSPNGTGELINGLASVSCTSSVACTAVGHAASKAGEQPSVTLAERWNGTAWSIQSTPNPSGATESTFTDVSCSSSNSCMAVGNSNKEHNSLANAPVGLTESWNGSEWQLLSSNLAGSLYAVACGSPSLCEAIGRGTEPPFGQRWNGVGWSTLDLAPPIGETEPRLLGLSCSSETACTGVGSSYSLGGGIVPLAERLTEFWPVATTEKASGVTAEAASLHASVNPRGFETSYQFEYGATTSYGHSVPVSAESIGKGSTAVPVSQTISGLSPQTTYHFRVVATSVAGTVYGADQTLTTGYLLHWYGCVKQAGGQYQTSECRSTGSPNGWELVKFSEGEKPTVASSGGPFVLSTKAHGIKFTLKCEIDKASGWLENPTGGSNGGGALTAELSGCTVQRPEGLACKVAEPIRFAPTAKLVSVGGEDWAALKPTAEGRFAKVTIESCKEGASVLNGSYYIEGATNVLVSDMSSALVFSASTSGLTFSGEALTIEGESKVELQGGGLIKAEPAPPTASTESASSVTAIEATFAGTVNPDGLDTHYQFEYGTTKSYGQVVPATAVDIGSGMSNVKLMQTTGSLAPGTEYHFRIVATNSAGTVYGADQAFTTSTKLHWSGCKKQASGKYKNNGCGEEGAPNEWEWTKLKEGEKVSIVSSGGPIIMHMSIASIKVEIKCGSRKDESWVENPSGGGMGVGTTKAKLTSCTVVKPGEECQVEEPITFAGRTELAFVSGKAEEKYFPEGGVFTVVTISKCKSGAELLNGSYKIEGSYYGIINNKTSSQSFTEATSELKFAGTSVVLEGEAHGELEGGGGLKVN